MKTTIPDKTFGRKEKSSKIGHDKKNLIFTFAFFVIAIVEILFLKGRLVTRLWLHPNLKFF